MGFTPDHLGHINIYVRNAELSHKWCEDVLGLHTYDFMPGRAAFMSANLGESHEIALMEVGEDAPLQQPGQVGLNHMAWRMGNLDDLKELYHRLEEKTVKARPADHGLSLGLYFTDPDGNEIEVYHELPRGQWHAQEDLFMSGEQPKGRFPSPWDEQLAEKQVVAR